jgi:3-deoxy-manno-octulosonate cytidylyltransferase (CMP-KDO synthetase)|tara:strand:+ start:397 stop:1113 length:717 start_codon:yes stop_codon:yes gene_type:complete
MHNYVITIPCRLNSKRFPEKLIQKFKGKEIFVHTYERCAKVCPKKNIFVLTDSDKIMNTCKKYNINFIPTKKNILTGSDRIASIRQILKSKVYINVQGDEPIINPKDILKIINIIKKNNKIVLNGYTQITSKEAKIKSLPKVIFDKNENLIYMSRNAIPADYTKKKNNKFFKQVCIYAYPRDILKYFNNKKTFLENLEDIEILRLVENSINVKMIRLSSTSFSIDLLSDLKKLKRIKG